MPAGIEITSTGHTADGIWAFARKCRNRAPVCLEPCRLIRSSQLLGALRTVGSPSVRAHLARIAW